MSYQIIFFDLDDTLIDFSASEAISLQKIYAKFYPHLTYDVFKNTYAEINAALWRRVGAEENGLMPSEVRLLRFEQLHEKLPSLIPAEEVANEYDHHLGEHADWLPQVKKAVEFLHRKGHILGIITNGLSDAQAKKRARLGLLDWFDCFVVSDDVGTAKPNKAIFEMALEEIARKRNQPTHVYDKNSILMVGDSIISDAHGAKNFGVHYCHIDKNLPNIDLLEANIKYQLTSVAQLPLCIGYATEYELFS